MNSLHKLVWCKLYREHMTARPPWHRRRGATAPLALPQGCNLSLVLIFKMSIFDLALMSNLNFLSPAPCWSFFVTSRFIDPASYGLFSHSSINGIVCNTAFMLVNKCHRFQCINNCQFWKYLTWKAKWVQKISTWSYCGIKSTSVSIYDTYSPWQLEQHWFVWFSWCNSVLWSKERCHHAVAKAQVNMVRVHMMIWHTSYYYGYLWFATQAISKLINRTGTLRQNLNCRSLDW
jgi:hypothetical protein